MAIDYTGFAFGKDRPAVLERQDRRKEEAREDVELRAAARERDHHRCRCCGHLVTAYAVDPAKRAEVNHIRPRSLAKNLKRQLSNLLTVCAICHAKITAHEITLVGSTAETVRVVRRGREG